MPPFIEPVAVAGEPGGLCDGPDDDKFFACAEVANADVIVSGDEYILRPKKFKGCSIVTVEKFLKKFRHWPTLYHWS